MNEYAQKEREEIWDLLDDERKPIGRVQRRGDPVAPGEYHTVVEIWTFSPSGEILLTLRSPEKEEYPNYWEDTGGSAQAGETSLAAAVRELGEETGLKAGEEGLTLLHTCRMKDSFVDIYGWVCHAPLSQVRLQPFETCDVRWASYDQLLKDIAEGKLAWPVVYRWMLSFESWDAFRRSI